VFRHDLAEIDAIFDLFFDFGERTQSDLSPLKRSQASSREWI
jgi:hypothetical protein